MYFRWFLFTAKTRRWHLGAPKKICYVFRARTPRESATQAQFAVLSVSQEDLPVNRGVGPTALAGETAVGFSLVSASTTLQDAEHRESGPSTSTHGTTGGVKQVMMATLDSDRYLPSAPFPHLPCSSSGSTGTVTWTLSAIGYCCFKHKSHRSSSLPASTTVTVRSPTMRASVSIYEDPEPKSEADVWADGESRATLFGFLAVFFVAASTVGYIAYSLLGSERGLGALISQFPRSRYPPSRL
ncbi:hypothetical protein C8F04DRAFT_625659 [Mycena alexandri]|uniref:Uncharacterized protein n=1 Tax=Mycena alexandri TaxID=1745969 RepID=A0AAD6WQI8_9AGAR|nr:hypothetical protein C8F04DRAFT_183059 [Mycena alexandri]KAJ7033473.1 hypothetical protein C8F04DRAFT_625659 [Mycena alexandri]